MCLKFSKLDEFQNHVETLGHCLNVETFEITSVHMHAINVCAAFSEKSHINGDETINELPVSGNKRKHAETRHCQTDEQKQATLAKRREAYQKKKACETKEQRHAKLAKERENSKKRKASETDDQREAELAKRRENYQKTKTSETDDQREAKLAKRRENYQNKKASVSDEQRQANHAKKIDNYRKRKASEPDEQREAKRAKRRENYEKRKAFQETVPIQEQSTCDSNECDSRSSTNLTDKNQYLREFDADKNGELHLQQWAKVNMSKFHKSLKYTTLQCTVCKEAWPLKATKRSRTNYVCMRCTRDKKCPKAFSSENSLTPSKVPPQLQGLTQTEEMLIARALPIMRVYIKPGGQRGYSGHCINLPQDIKELASSLPRYPKDIALIVVKVKGRNNTFKDIKVRKEKVQNALQWLIENNPHYAGVDMNLEALNSLPENGVPADILTVDTDAVVLSDENAKPDSSSGPCSLNPDEDVVYNSSSEMSSFLPVGEQKQQEMEAIRNLLFAEEPIQWPTVSNDPLNEYQTPFLATMAFPTLFPNGKGDPTNQALLRDVPLHERIKHLLKFAENIDGKWVYRLPVIPDFHIGLLTCF